MRKNAETPPRGKGLRVMRRPVGKTSLVLVKSPRRLSDDESVAVREVAARSRARMKELFGKNACSYADIGDDPAWIEKRLSPTGARLSLSDALRILKGLELHAAPFSPRESRNVEVNEVLWWIRYARMRLLEPYDIHPEYDAIASAMRRVLFESGAVDDVDDPRVEEALRPFRDLLRSVCEELVATVADGEVLATLDLMPDSVTEGKLRERRSTASDGSTMSTFEGNSRAWLDEFMPPTRTFLTKINASASNVEREDRG